MRCLFANPEFCRPLSSQGRSPYDEPARSASEFRSPGGSMSLVHETCLTRRVGRSERTGKCARLVSKAEGGGACRALVSVGPALAELRRRDHDPDGQPPAAFLDHDQFLESYSPARSALAAPVMPEVPALSPILKPRFESAPKEDSLKEIRPRALSGSANSLKCRPEAALKRSALQRNWTIGTGLVCATIRLSFAW